MEAKIKIIKRITGVLITLIFLFLGSSCRETCPYKPVSYAGIAFHSVVDGNDRVVAPTQLTIFGLDRSDTLLFDKAPNVSSVNLPFDGNSSYTSYVFDFGEGFDTISFYYSVNPYFISGACGFGLNFETDQVVYTSNSIDSVLIVVKEISSFNETNFKIYY